MPEKDGYFTGSRHFYASILPRQRGFCKGEFCGIIKENERGRTQNESAKRCGYCGGGADREKHEAAGLYGAVFFAGGTGVHLPAKEAFGKAMGVGLSGWAMPEAAVTYGETGAPYFTLSGEAEKLAEGWQLALSLSHDGGYAIAMVTAYRPD